MFEPTPRSYRFKTNKKERVLAVKSALTHKYNDKELVVVDNLELDNLKTKNVVKLIEKLNLDGKVLFVSSGEAENLYMATKNLGYADTVMINDLSVLDIVNADTLVIDEGSITTLEEVLS